MARKDERSSGDANNTSNVSKRQIAKAFGEKVKNAKPEQRNKMIDDLEAQKRAADRDRN